MAVVELNERSLKNYIIHLQDLVRKEKTVYIDELSVEDMFSDEKNPIMYHAKNAKELNTYLDSIKK